MFDAAPVYLDHAGAAQHSQEQLARAVKLLSTQPCINPHRYGLGTDRCGMQKQAHEMYSPCWIVATGQLLSPLQ